MRLDGVTSPLVSGGLIAGLTVVGLAVVQFLGRRALRFAHSIQNIREARRQQLVTLIQILEWGASLLIAGSALLMLLSTFGVDITPLLASAGIAGLAVSLGAQSLIKDLIGGFLILVENQYAVGDSIQLKDVSGQVERITLRTTYVRDINGDLYVVPNGEVRVVANKTKGWSRALVDVGVAYEEDQDRVLSVLEEIAETLANDPTFGPRLLGPPQVMGPLSLGDWAITVRVMVKTQPGKQWEVARELRKRINATFAQEGIAMPYPRQEVLVRGLEPDEFE
jgi:small-conductance mechanosensitive channel